MKFDLSIDFADDGFVRNHNSFSILYGSSPLTVFNAEGQALFCRKDLTHTMDYLFLPQGAILLEDLKLHAYLVVSMDTGKELWRVDIPRKTNGVCKLILSPDGLYVYTVRQSYSENYYLTVISLNDRTLETFALQRGLSCIKDISLDENGVICLLETQIQEVAGQAICENGIRYVDLNGIDPYSSYYWQSKWTSKPDHGAAFFFNHTDTVITKNVCLYHTKSTTYEDLLENESSWKTNRPIPTQWHMDADGKYLILPYDQENIIVDISGKKVIARYAMEFSQGDLFGDAFWVVTKEGLVPKPFPIMEEIPQDRGRFA